MVKRKCFYLQYLQFTIPPDFTRVSKSIKTKYAAVVTLSGNSVIFFVLDFLKFFLIFSFVYSHVPSVTPLSLYPGVTTKNKNFIKTLDNRVQTPPTTGRRGDRVVTSIPGGIRSGITGNPFVDLYTVVSKIPWFTLI